jgi:hypothetical protein
MPLLSDSLCRASGVPASESLEEMVCGTLCARMGFFNIPYLTGNIKLPIFTALKALRGF